MQSLTSSRTKKSNGQTQRSLYIGAAIALGITGITACGSSRANPVTQVAPSTAVAPPKASETSITLTPTMASTMAVTTLPAAPASTIGTSTVASAAAPAAAQPTPVTQAAIAFPIAAGQTENWKAALADLIGPRYSEYQASRARYGLDQQTTTLQSTPMGDFAIIYMEGADLNKTTEVMATSPDTWDVKWRDMTTGLHGADFNDPNALKIDAHLVLNTGDLTAAQKVGLKPLGFMIPLKEDGARDMRQRLDEVLATKGDEYRRSRTKLGIAEEKVFLEKTAIGPALVVYWEAIDPVASLQALAASTDPFDTWFAKEFYNQHLVDSGFLAGMFAKNTLIADFPHD
jgi:hypothetical protein